MSGLLPGTRPLSANYGQDLENERPVEDPSRELGAENWNPAKADLAYCARMVPKYRGYVTNNGVTAVVTAVFGPENAVVGNVTATRTGAGIVTLVWSSTGVAAVECRVFPSHAATPSRGSVIAPTSNGCTIRTYDATSAGTLLDANFAFELY